MTKAGKDNPSRLLYCYGSTTNTYSALWFSSQTARRQNTAASDPSHQPSPSGSPDARSSLAVPSSISHFISCPRTKRHQLASTEVGSGPSKDSFSRSSPPCAMTGAVSRQSSGWGPQAMPPPTHW